MLSIFALPKRNKALQRCGNSLGRSLKMMKDKYNLK